MIKVYQSIIADADAELPGDCLRAAVASLFELPLEEVPHFLLQREHWWESFEGFITDQGWEYNGQWNNPRCPGYWGKDHYPDLPQYSGGVKGYYLATVYSPRFFDICRMDEKGYNPSQHAVVVEPMLNEQGKVVDFKIAHDPNPAYAGIENYPLSNLIGYHGIKGVDLIDPIGYTPPIYENDPTFRP